MGLPYRILNRNPKKELLFSLWVFLNQGVLDLGVQDDKNPFEGFYKGSLKGLL